MDGFTACSQAHPRHRAQARKIAPRESTFASVNVSCSGDGQPLAASETGEAMRCEISDSG